MLTGGERLVALIQYLTDFTHVLHDKDLVSSPDEVQVRGYKQNGFTVHCTTETPRNTETMIRMKLIFNLRKKEMNM